MLKNKSVFLSIILCFLCGTLATQAFWSEKIMIDASATKDLYLHLDLDQKYKLEFVNLPVNSRMTAMSIVGEQVENEVIIYKSTDVVDDNLSSQHSFKTSEIIPGRVSGQIHLKIYADRAGMTQAANVLVIDFDIKKVAKKNRD